MKKNARKVECNVPVTLLLVKNHRDPDGVARVQAIATQLGMNVTSAGKTSVCCTVSGSVYKKMFGTKPIKIDEKPAGSFDVGTPSGFAADDSLSVPSELQNLVEIISVEPPSTRLVESSPVK